MTKIAWQTGVVGTPEEVKVFFAKDFSDFFAKDFSDFFASFFYLAISNYFLPNKLKFKKKSPIFFADGKKTVEGGESFFRLSPFKRLENVFQTMYTLN